MITGAALDLGTTRVKAALLAGEGRLENVLSLPSPALSGEGLIRESDPREYLAVAREALGRTLPRKGSGIPVGLASQRSSFLLWERGSGTPLTPLLSWQDRRALQWCEKRRDESARITAETGLPLSPHYVGPKAALLLEEDGTLRKMAAAGSILLGTLDSWLIWNLTTDRRHVTDRSMAARTLLAGLGESNWTGGLLDFFGIPRAMLPSIVPTWGRDDRTGTGARLAASMADQPAACLALPGTGDGSALVNLGTGGFVIVPSGASLLRRDGYLTAPTAAGPSGEVRYALEGTVNGIAAALAGLEEPPLPAVDDPCPDLYCIPDSAGIGAPYWRPGQGPLFSGSGREFSRPELARIIREGVIFRVCAILEDLSEPAEDRDCFLTGGLSRDIFLTAGIASCRGEKCFLFKEKEATLLGVGLLSAGLKPPAGTTTAVEPSETYLAGKFVRWKEWVSTLMDDPP